MSRIAPIALVLVLALALAGCGAAEADGDLDADTEATETTQEQEASPIATQQVVEEFLASEEGAELEEAASPDPAWDQLGLGLDPTPAEQRRYGTFSIYVVDPERDEAVESLLTDKETLQPLEPDSQGIYWDYDELARSYVAHKRYGPNVVLAWWNEQEEPGTDARWQRLDSLLQGLSSG
ncbi:MAG TPA: hypothetical protein VK915_01265 [Gaiellaceae bacterium]|nr:hypothetical protein [Gaiellaceae bacterium]